MMIKGRWISKNNDFFGCIDIIALPTLKTSDRRVRLVQVHTNESHMSEKRKEILNNLKGVKDVLIEIWLREKFNNRVVYRVYTHPFFDKKSSYLVSKDGRKLI